MSENRKQRRAKQAAQERQEKKHAKLKSDFLKAKRSGDVDGILKVRDRIRQMKNE